MMPSETQHGLARCVAVRIPRHRTSIRARSRCEAEPRTLPRDREDAMRQLRHSRRKGRLRQITSSKSRKSHIAVIALT